MTTYPHPRATAPEPGPRYPSTRWIVVVLSAVVCLLLAALLNPPAWTLNLGNPGDERYIAGFSIPEHSGATPFRWSGPAARLMLHGASTGPLLLDLRIHGNAAAPAGGELLVLQQATRPPAALAVTAEWRTYHTLLAAASEPGASLDVRPLSVQAPTYRPSSADSRDLGVALSWVRIQPLPGTSPVSGALLLQALGLSWGIALIAACLWFLDAWLLPRTAPHLKSIGLSSILLALGAAALARTNPYLLAWALPPLPWSLGFGTLLLVIAAPAARRRPDTPPDNAAGVRQPGAEPVRRRGATWLALGALVVLALALRLYRLEALPYGLWRDEARHGLVALEMLEDPSYRPAYVPSVALPGLGLYPFMVALRLWGVHIWSLRLLTALAGAATVLPLFGFARRLTARDDVALLAAAFLAVSSWHITISRFSFPTVFDPLLTLTGLWLLLRSLERRRPSEAAPAWRSWSSVTALGSAAGAGLCLGCAMQTYHSGRVAPVIAGVLVVLLGLQRRYRRREWLGLAICGATLLVTAWPLLRFAVEQSAVFNARIDQVFLLSSGAREGRAPLAILDASIGRHLLMFNIRGDANGRHHAPGAPLLDVITGVGLLIGMFRIVRRWRTWPHSYLLLALGVAIAPSVLAVEGPHAMRSIHALDLACIIAALGWIDVWQALRRRVRWSPALLDTLGALRQRPARLLGTTVVVAAGLLNVHTYFISMAHDPAVWQSFSPVATQIGAYVRTLHAQCSDGRPQTIFVAAPLARSDVFAYLAHGLPIKTFEGAPVAEPESCAVYVLSGPSVQADSQAIPPFLRDQPEAALAGPLLPDGKTPAFMVYAWDGAAHSAGAP